MSINNVNLSGNLTRDPELRSTSTGKPVLGFGIAVNERRRNVSTGEYEDYANFFNCVMFGNRSEALAKYLTKGTKVSIHGHLRWSQYERDGQKRDKVDVIVEELEFMSQRKAADDAAPANQTTAPAHSEQIAEPSGKIYDEDIPF